jgi:anti-anti-sigma factor
VLLRQAARQSLSTPKLKGIILDVSRIAFVDSSGLGELTIVYSSASRHNCPMCLSGISANLQKMLEMTHLDNVLNSAPELTMAKRQVQTA